MADGDVEESTLPNGTPAIHYNQLPNRAIQLEQELSIGVAEGDEAYMLGDIRSVESSKDGTIYVLDYQAKSIRAFDKDGVFIKTIVSGGEGPGEITQANGMILKGDSILWIQDHGKMRMMGVSKDGQELSSRPMHVLSYAYIYSGTVDDNGKMWKTGYTGSAPRQSPPEEGLLEGSGVGLWVSIDPKTEKRDSISMGPFTNRSYVTKMNNGFRMMGIPFQSGSVARVHPKGGFWLTDNKSYSVARLDEKGDSLLVISVNAKPNPVTTEDKRKFKENMVERSPDEEVTAEKIIALMPDTKPFIQDLITDEEGRLWVQRVTEVDEPQVYDVFQDDGTFVSTVQIGFDLVSYFPIRHRNGHIYGLQTDEMGVPHVVRSTKVEM